VIVGIDPGLQATGFATVDLQRKAAATHSVHLPSRKPKGLTTEGFLAYRLNVIFDEVRGWLNRWCSLAGILCVIENARVLKGNRQHIDPDTIVRLGLAVGTAYGAARELAACRIVQPDWTWRVLCHAQKGGASKDERHKQALIVLAVHGIPWPAELPDDIAAGSDAEHRADALTLCAAYLRAET
jgi:Holliday junction resolvasome RuvABC endonuclease subunit